MSAILKLRIPFFRRKTNGGTDGFATLYLKSTPAYLPAVNQKIIITHTDVPDSSGLKTKLAAISTNVVAATFQKFEQNATQESIVQSDEYQYFLQIRYEDVTFSTTQFGGDCRGYIEYDINPSIYNVLKPIESAVIVNETVPFDLVDGINTLDNRIVDNTYPDTFLKGFFVKRTDTNTIFANLMKSLNLPVSDEELKKYTRSPLGLLEITTGTTYDSVIDGSKYKWTQWTDTGTTTETLVVHPTTGYTGEYYGTVLQPIGSHEFNTTNKTLLPIPNNLYLIYEIPNTAYGEIIDGKSIKFRLPYYTASAAAADSIEEKLGIYTYDLTPSSINEIYGTYNKKNLSTVNLDKVTSEIDLSVKDIGIRPDLTSSTYESNIVLLFSDSVKTPQQGGSWADGYADLIDGTRVFNPTATEKATYNYMEDRCVGFVALDKGFVVITHPLIVDSYFNMVFSGTIASVGATVASAYKTYDINGSMSTNLTRTYIKTNPSYMLTTKDNSDNVIWDSTQFVIDNASVTGNTETNNYIKTDIEFISYNTEKSLNIVCLASADEFFKSTNDTAKELTTTAVSDDFTNFKSENQNLYPVIITQLGIHDAQGNLLAICKPAQPIKKYWWDIASFNVRIRL
jgi:hypothetical protein